MLKFPKKEQQVVNDHLNGELRKKINIICQYHLENKKAKKLYPYLKTHKIMVEKNPEKNADLKKIEYSLLKNVSDIFMEDKKFTRSLNIKGYTKAVHVDAKANQLEVSRTYAYKNQYTRRLFPHTSNVDYKKIDEERRNEQRDSEKTDGPTAFKAIKMQFNKQKKNQKDDKENPENSIKPS